MTRSASNSIAGYSYQFHESLLMLLSLSGEEETVVLEGIEDIDLHNQCIQVKYLPSKKLLPSVVQKPASLMLKDYVLNYDLRQNTSYRIYAYFGNPSGDGDFLNEIEFYNRCAQLLIDNDTNPILKITGEIQIEFKEKFCLKIGEDLESKEKSVKQKLRDAFSSTGQEVDLYYYPSAMNFILAQSIKMDEADRVISKKSFLDFVNKKKKLFGIWQKLKKGKESVLLDVKKQLNSSDFNHNKERLIFIDSECLTSDDSGYGDSQLLMDLVEKHSLVDKKHTATPLIVVVNMKKSALNSLKIFLIGRGIEFNDGHESIDFSVDAFNKKPVINTKRPKHVRIKKSSYEIKLIHLSTYLAHFERLNKPYTAVYFSKDVPFDLSGAIQYHVPVVETYRDVNRIIN